MKIIFPLFSVMLLTTPYLNAAEPSNEAAIRSMGGTQADIKKAQQQQATRDLKDAFIAYYKAKDDKKVRSQAKQQMQAALQQGADPDVRLTLPGGKQEMPLAFHIIYQKLFDLLPMLLERDVTADFGTDTLLLAYIKAGGKDNTIVERIIKLNPDLIDELDINDTSALRNIIESRDTFAIDTLLRAEADVEDSLFFAVVEGDYDIAIIASLIDAFLQQDGNLDTPDDEMKTLLFYALENDQKPVIDLLLVLGAAPIIPTTIRQGLIPNQQYDLLQQRLKKAQERVKKYYEEIHKSTTIPNDVFDIIKKYLGYPETSSNTGKKAESSSSSSSSSSATSMEEDDDEDEPMEKEKD